MAKIYKGQSKVRIKVNLLLSDIENISGATALIKYTKPDGVNGQFTAVIEDEFKGIIYYDVLLTSELDVIGKWTMWAHITFPDNRVAPSDPFTLEIFKEGSTC